MHDTRSFTSIAEVPEPDMRALASSSGFYDNSQWMRYCELAARGSLRYLALTDHCGRITALTAVHIFAAPPAPALRRPETLIDNQISDASVLYPCLMGVLDGTHSPILVAPGQEGNRTGCVAELTAACAMYGHNHDVTTVAFPYLASQSDAQAACAALGAAGPVVSAGVAMLTGDWTDFDHYLGSLSSHQRISIRHERRQFADAGYHVRAGYGTSDLDESTALMQVSMLVRHGTASSVQSLLEGYQMLKSTVEDSVITFRCERSGKLAGIVICLRHDDTLYVRAVGIPAGGSTFEYFNTVFYSPIEWGIQNGIRRFGFGTGAYKAKRFRGCVFEPRYAAVKWPEAHASSCFANSRHVHARICGELGITELAGGPP